MTRSPRVPLATLLAAVAATAALLSLLGAGPPAARLERETAVLGLRLGPATMADVRRRLGPAPLVHDGGDAASSATHVCYRDPGGVTLAFRCWECGSAEERRGDGASLHVDELWLAARDDAIDWGAPDAGWRVADGFAPSCAASTAISRATRLGALRLGMTRGDVVRALGPPARDAPGVLEYEADRRHLTVALERGKVVSLRATRSWE